MKAIAYKDRVFEKECPQCEALLKYTPSDIINELTTFGKSIDSSVLPTVVKLGYEQYPIYVHKLTCPLCGYTINLKLTVTKEV